MQPVRFGGSTQIVAQQEHDIIGALPKRWYVDLDDVQTEVEVLAEHTGFDALPQVPVGRGDQPHVRAARHAVDSDRLDLSSLGKSQEYCLHSQTHLAELVEKQRAAIGLSHQPRLVSIGAREASSRMPEQFGLEKRFRNSAAVDRHKCARRTSALLVNKPRDDLFARACLTEHEHLRIGARSGFDLATQRHNGRAFPQQQGQIFPWHWERRHLAQFSESQITSKELVCLFGATKVNGKVT